MARQSSGCRTGHTGVCRQKEGESDEKPQRKRVLKESFSEKNRQGGSLPKGNWFAYVRKDEGNRQE